MTNDKNNLIVYCEWDEDHVADVSLELSPKAACSPTNSE